MEIPFQNGRLVTEPVPCPDGNHLKMRWWNSYDVETLASVPGIEVIKGSDPKQFLGTGVWYSLDDLARLGGNDIQEGINLVGRAWYVVPAREIRTPRPLDQEIKALR